LLWAWDRAYLDEAARRGRRASVLTDIRGIKVRGWLAPFTIEGSPELIEIGYEAGFGARNSMGFGMAE
jgi:CRISPR-associated endoribonuclease Cas6